MLLGFFFRYEIECRVRWNCLYDGLVYEGALSIFEEIEVARVKGLKEVWLVN